MIAILKSIRQYALIIVVTLLAMELISFGILVWRSVDTESMSSATQSLPASISIRCWMCRSNA